MTFMDGAPTGLSFNDVAALAKANNDAYLAAYRVGYEAGFRTALEQAVNIVNGMWPTVLPDGPEERTADQEEVSERECERIDLDDSEGRCAFDEELAKQVTS